jgi:adenylosuccinate synthase
MSRGKVTALVGGQYGSEGKGLIAGHIARDYGVHVRTGAANAGHTVYTLHGPANGESRLGAWEKHVMQQIPCAAYANPDAELVIGPGALISPEIFGKELELLAEWRRQRGLDPRPVFVDGRAHVIHQDQIDREAESGLDVRIGSTSTIAREGIGVAQADRVMRADCVLARDFYNDVGPRIAIVDVPRFLNGLRAVGYDILLEGTQGTGLSLTTGAFPYVTSRNTTAAGLAADAGVPPNAIEDVILVCRSYPIRVAGPSGPFYEDSREISWEDIGVNPENERTTVTKKVRRVATFSLDQVAEAASINGATEIALTFADYLTPGLHGFDGRVEARASGLSSWSEPRPPELETFGFFPIQATFDAGGKVDQLIDRIQIATGLPVHLVGTGPHSVATNMKAERARSAA